jgi:hypothetical protein
MIRWIIRSERPSHDPSKDWHIYMYQPDFRPIMTRTALNMANSTNNSGWEEFLLGMPSPSAVLPASLSPDSQSLNQASLSDTGDLAEAQDWFSSAGNMANLATIAEDSTSRRPSIQKSPSKMLNDAFAPRRSSQLYVQRSEFIKEIRGLTEKLNKLQER